MSEPNHNRPFSRREFVTRLAVTSLATAGGTEVSAGNCSPAAANAAATAQLAHQPNADPSKPWVITQPANHVSGIPLGGIGTGSVEIRPDGTFADWLIFNMGAWSPGQGPEQGGSNPGMDTDAFALYLGPKKRRRSDRAATERPA